MPIGWYTSLSEFLPLLGRDKLPDVGGQETIDKYANIIKEL